MIIPFLLRTIRVWHGKLQIFKWDFSERIGLFFFRSLFCVVKNRSKNDPCNNDLNFFYCIKCLVNVYKWSIFVKNSK